MHVAVSCIYWEGDFRGRNYSEKWVYRLHNMCKRNISVPFDFVCLSNTPAGDVQLKNNWPGWWSKMEQFRIPEFLDFNVVLCLDLDILIMNNIDELFNIEGPIMFAPQTEMNLGNRDKEGKRRVQAYRTGAFAFKPDEVYEYGLDFSQNSDTYIKQYRGDQDWWGDKIDAFTYPKNWFCKTKHIKDKPPDDVKIIFGNHIKNDQAIKKWDWAKEIWQ